MESIAAQVIVGDDSSGTDAHPNVPTHFGNRSEPDTVSFNRSTMQGSEWAYMTQAIASGELGGDHQFSRKCQDLLERELGAAKAFVTPSCTHALEMAALLLEVGAGDEIIVPSFTFVSTANAFALRGATPVFCDVRPDTLCLDEAMVESLVTSRTKAIVPVHYAGVACEMDEICRVAERHGLTIIEDNAHGLFGRYKGRHLGSFGRMATQSFHETKNFTAGEGGALIINDPDLVQRAEIVREKGTDRSKFFRGEIDKYSWVDTGSSYVMSDLLAAFLYGQLEQRHAVQARRKALWHRYDIALRDWCQDNGVQRPHIPEHTEPAWHMYYLILPTPQQRTAFLEHMNARRISAVFHYLPLHLSRFAAQWGGQPGDCPVTERASSCLVRLPLYNSLSDAQQDRVIEATMRFAT